MRDMYRLADCIWYGEGITSLNCDVRFWRWEFVCIVVFLYFEPIADFLENVFAIYGFVSG
jgi:hypothetical protein